MLLRRSTLTLWRRAAKVIAPFWFLMFYYNLLAYFHRVRRNGCLGTSGQKSEPAIYAPATSIYYKTDAFPLPSDVYWIHSMFMCYYVAWPFDLESVSCTVLLMSGPYTNFYYPMTIGYWVTSSEYVITFPLSETVTTHAPYHVTSNRKQK